MSGSICTTSDDRHLLFCIVLTKLGSTACKLQAGTCVFRNTIDVVERSNSCIRSIQYHHECLCHVLLFRIDVGSIYRVDIGVTSEGREVEDRYHILDSRLECSSQVEVTSENHCTVSRQSSIVAPSLEVYNCTISRVVVVERDSHFVTLVILFLLGRNSIGYILGTIHLYIDRNSSGELIYVSNRRTYVSVVGTHFRINHTSCVPRIALQHKIKILLCVLESLTKIPVYIIVTKHFVLFRKKHCTLKRQRFSQNIQCDISCSINNVTCSKNHCIINTHQFSIIRISGCIIYQNVHTLARSCNNIIIDKESRTRTNISSRIQHYKTCSSQILILTQQHQVIIKMQHCTNFIHITSFPQRLGVRHVIEHVIFDNKFTYRHKGTES